jgi:hypothetical protein
MMTVTFLNNKRKISSSIPCIYCAIEQGVKLSSNHNLLCIYSAV